MSDTQIQVEDSPQLKTFRDRLIESAERALNKIGEKIPISGITIKFTHDPPKTIPGTGYGGFTPNSQLVLIYLDPSTPAFVKNMDYEILGTLAHELHHTLRWKGPGYGTTLLEALVTEGLAGQFEAEVTGVPNRSWEKSLTVKQIKELRPRAEREYSNEHYNHQAWFFGSEKLGIPRWTGYTLGFELVGRYLDKHRELKPSELYDVTASSIL